MARRKVKMNLALISISLIALFLIVFIVAPRFAAVSSSPINPSSGFILKPEWGYTKCEVVVGDLPINMTAQGSTITVSNSEASNIYAKAVDVYATCYGNDVDNVFFLQDEKFHSDAPCTIANQKWACVSSVAEGGIFNSIDSIENKLEFNLQYGERITLRCDAGLIGSVSGIKVKLQGDSYGLVTYNFRSPTPVDTIVPMGCDLSKIDTQYKDNLVGNRTGKMTFGEIAPFVIDWSPTLTYQPLTYENKAATCSGGKIYAVESIKFLDGNTYKIAGSLIGEELCCPGQKLTSNLICNSEFQYVEVGGSEDDNKCVSDADVLGGGGYVAQNTSASCDNLFVEKYTCVNHKPTILAGSAKKVECLQPSTCCAGGEVCGTDFKCYFQGKAICGDGICAASETAASCAKDCVSKDGGSSWLADLFKNLGNWLAGLFNWNIDDMTALLIGVVVAIIVIAIIIMIIMPPRYGGGVPIPNTPIVISLKGA